MNECFIKIFNLVIVYSVDCMWFLAMITSSVCQTFKSRLNKTSFINASANPLTQKDISCVWMIVSTWQLKVVLQDYKLYDDYKINHTNNPRISFLPPHRIPSGNQAKSGEKCCLKIYIIHKKWEKALYILNSEPQKVYTK